MSPSTVVRRQRCRWRGLLAVLAPSGFALVLALALTPPLHAEPALASTCGPENLLAGRAPASALEITGDPALVTNGWVAAEGTNWDAAPAVVLRSGAAEIVYDLGQRRSIGAIYVQADANDVYQVTGSDDGSPGSYKLIAQIENVLGGKGPGLRARWMIVPPTEARFVRFGDGRGDNFYSLSELALYCTPPAPFPPAFKIVGGGSVAPAPVDGVPSEGDQSGDAPSRRYSGLILAAFVLALAGALAARAGRGTGTGGAGGEPAAAGAPRDRTRSLLVLFVASGCAALIYEVVWLHLLRLVIGASALSVGIVLASFMGGMFLGSLYFARVVSPAKNPLRVYAALELGIGIFGLLMPALLPVVRSVYVGLFGYGALGIALRAVISALLLLPPTALMGATLPAVARLYSRGPEGSSQLAALYAANTSGAVLGCLLSGFVLLAYGDVWIATLAAVALNLAIAAAGWRLGRDGAGFGSAATVAVPAEPQPAPAVPAAPVTPAAPAAAATLATAAAPAAHLVRYIYVAAALSGFTALGAQVVWTRILTLLFGATVYAFAIILAVFLGGLGIGSALAAWWLRRGRDPARGLAMTQLLLVPALFLSGVLLAEVLPYASPTSATPIGPLHALHVLRAIDVILPSAILWGASFPFALAAAGAGHGDAGQSTGYVYAANTIGSILAAVGVSFWAIPHQGTRWASQALLAAAALSAAMLFRALSRPDPRVAAPAGRSFALVLPAWSFWSLAAGALAVALLPGVSQVFLAHGRNIWWVNAHDKYLFVSEGAASTVAVHVAPDGYRNFHVSGRVEASNNPNDMRLQRLLGHLSALAHPHPKSALVVGLGAGVTAGALTLHPEIERIVICEIEPRVVGAARQFAVENYGVLSNPRVEVVFDDARHFLATTREKFDIITSDPIHPWVRGNSILFSREYYAIVRARLNPGGIATQWVPLYETNEAAIKIQMRTFMDAFPNGTVWNSAVGGNGYDVVLLGREEPLHLDLAGITQRMARSPRIAESLAAVKVRSPVDLLATFAARASDLTGWLEGTPVNRDFSLKLEYISGLALNDKEADAIYAHMIEGRRFPDDLFAGPVNLIDELRRRIH